VAIHRISLRIESPERTKFNSRSVFRQRVTAFGESSNMVPEIFLHQQTLGDDVQNEFVAVCSAYDLSVYPADAPVENTEHPFFRLATIDILLPSITVVDEFVSSLKAQVAVLVGVLDTLDDMTTTEICQIPATTTTPSP